MKKILNYRKNKLTFFLMTFVFSVLTVFFTAVYLNINNINPIHNLIWFGVIIIECIPLAFSVLVGLAL